MEQFKRVFTILVLALITTSALAGVGMDITPTTFDAGTGGAGEFSSWTPSTPAGGGAFTITNSGNTDGSLSIKASNMLPADWTLAATPGPNQFSLQWGKVQTQGTEPAWNGITGALSPFLSIPGGNSDRIDLRLQSPSSINPVTSQPQISTITMRIVPVDFGAVNYVSAGTWGSRGQEDGQFLEPQYIANDSAGNIYVSDDSRADIQKFTSDGTFLLKWGTGSNSRPKGIFVDGENNTVFVALHNSGVVNVYDRDGNFQRTLSGFVGPFDVAVDKSGFIYVLSYDAAGQTSSTIHKLAADGTIVATWDFSQHWFKADSLALSRDGYLYVVSNTNHSVFQISDSGQLIRSWGSEGAGSGEFSFPRGVSVDPVGNVYVGDPGNGRVQKFTPDGVFITQIGSLSDPWESAINFVGKVYVVERTFTSNPRIHAFEPQF